MDNLRYLEALPLKELKRVQRRITEILEDRKAEREELMNKYQKELDRLLDAIEGDGFYVGIPDCVSARVAVLEPEDEDEDD